MPDHDFDVFSVRDLRQRSSELVRAAEAGRVSVITKRGKPSALTLPFDRRLLELGIETQDPVIQGVGVELRQDGVEPLLVVAQPLDLDRDVDQ